MHELSLAQFAKRYQIDCAFCRLQLRSVDRTAAPNASLTLCKVDATSMQPLAGSRFP